MHAKLSIIRIQQVPRILQRRPILRCISGQADRSLPCMEVSGRPQVSRAAMLQYSTWHERLCYRHCRLFGLKQSAVRSEYTTCFSAHVRLRATLSGFPVSGMSRSSFTCTPQSSPIPMSSLHPGRVGCDMALSAVVLYVASGSPRAVFRIYSRDRRERIPSVVGDDVERAVLCQTV